MQVSVQTLSGLERQITVAVPAERIDGEVKTRLDSLSKRVRIAGFRPGKVPLNVVKQHYGSQVQSEVLGEVLQSSFYEAVTQEKLRPAGAPHIHPKARASGQPLEYTATFEIYPDVQLRPLGGIEIEKPAAEITEQDVDQVVENIRKQRPRWVAVERASQVGDRVRVDFTGTKNGAEFAGNQGQDMVVEIGKRRMIPGFEEQLTGATAGAKLAFDLRFPADYHAKELADQEVHFEVVVNAVEESRLPDIDADFIRSLGISEPTVEALRQDVRQNMQRELNERARAVLKQNVMDALLKANPLDVPKALVQQEIQTLTKGQDGAGMPELNAKLEDLGRRRVSLALILSEIVKQQNLKVDAKKLREAVEHFAATYEKPDEVVQWYYADKSRLRDVESYVLENEVVDWIAANVKIREVATTFDALIKQGQTAS